jgi:hypothetical protein
MWFAARDIAFESPTAKVDIEAMLARMGFGQPGSTAASGLAARTLPDDIDVNLELIANLMIRVLLIEVQAFHTFAWAEEWLADPDLVAGDGEAARLVTYIRADETPHVGYLKTALTEMRDRTWIGTSGSKHQGTDMIGALWAKCMDDSLGAGRVATRKAVLGEVEHWCLQRPNGTDVVAEFHALGDGAEAAA